MMIDLKNKLRVKIYKKLNIAFNIKKSIKKNLKDINIHIKGQNLLFDALFD